MKWPVPQNIYGKSWIRPRHQAVPCGHYTDFPKTLALDVAYTEDALEVLDTENPTVQRNLLAF